MNGALAQAGAFLKGNNMSSGNDFSGLAPKAYASVDITYVSSSERIDTVTFKDAEGDTLAILTFTYDGSNRLTNVEKS